MIGKTQTGRTASGKTESKRSNRSTAEFDREFAIDSFAPPSSKALAKWRKAKAKKPGRPRQGQGSKNISVSIERELLDVSDELAKKMGISRAKLIARGLKAVLASQGLKAP